MTGNLALQVAQHQSDFLDRQMKFKTKNRLRLEVELNGGNQKALAYATATDEAALSRMLSLTCQDSLPAHKLPATVGELGPGIMEFIALQCGGTYLHNLMPETHPGSSMALVGLLAAHSGRLVQLILQHLEDQVWTREEKAEALPLLRKLRSVVDTLINDAEGGDGCES